MVTRNLPPGGARHLPPLPPLSQSVAAPAIPSALHSALPSEDASATSAPAPSAPPSESAADAASSSHTDILDALQISSWCACPLCTNPIYPAEGDTCDVCWKPPCMHICMCICTCVHRHRRRCAHCRLVGRGFKACGRCGKVRYCSLACQKAAWKVHKNECCN
jgi:hypothetical protein